MRIWYQRAKGLPSEAEMILRCTDVRMANLEALTFGCHDNWQGRGARQHGS